MSEVTVERYTKVKKSLEEVQTKISVLRGKSESSKSRLIALLTKYGVEKLSDLEALLASKEASAEGILSDIEKYVEEVKVKIAEADRILA